MLSDNVSSAFPKEDDTAALKKVLGDALDEYTKTITTRPFKVI